jgi:hypothetical protein
MPSRQGRPVASFRSQLTAVFTSAAIRALVGPVNSFKAK